MPAVPPEDHDSSGPHYLVKESGRRLYQDLVASAVRQADGRVLLTVGNRMPYTLRQVVLTVRDFGRFEPPDLAPGDAVTVLMPLAQSPPVRERLVVRAEYVTHGGLRHLELHVPRVAAAPQGDSAK